jgi:hypothetical protein
MIKNKNNGLAVLANDYIVTYLELINEPLIVEL